TSGRFCNHSWQVKLNNLTAIMDEQQAKRVLWKNVRDLMVRDYGKINVTRLGEDAGIGGSASRIKAQRTAVGLDVIVKVANKFKVAPHQLLMPTELRDAFSDKRLLDIVRIYRDTDDEGRRTLLTAAKIAEARINAGDAGVGSSGQANDR